MRNFQFRFKDAEGGTATIRAEVEADRFSMMGDYRDAERGGSSGQCQDSIKPRTDAQRDLLAMWERWHLNDMKAGCVHQRAAGWEDRRIDPKELPNSTANRDARGIVAHWVYKTEHPAGLLCEPCPECGYKYGSAWLKEELPADICDQLEALRVRIEAEEGPDDPELAKLGAHDRAAVEFLRDTKTEIFIEYKRHGKHFPEDKETRDIYSVTLRRGKHVKRVMEFDFGQSINASAYKIMRNNRVTHTFTRAQLEAKNCLYKKDSAPGVTPARKAGEINRMMFGMAFFSLSGEKIINPEPPSAYSVLSCLTKYEPGSFADFCAEFGYDEDSKTADRVYKAVCDEWKDLKTLYNDEELEKLADIN